MRKFIKTECRSGIGTHLAICDKCGSLVIGGRHPTGFHFNEAGYDKNLCRTCYEKYWLAFNKVQREFIEKFFYIENSELYAKEIEMMLK
jgi:hypothetical protein